jgi:3'(2'), 5'-bisphosphate nucleotidase
MMCHPERRGKGLPARLSARRVWIVVPLDGTREYGEGRTDWAVHIALSIDGEPKVGAVALPGLPMTQNYAHAPKPPGANRKPSMLASRTRPAHEALAVAELF